MHLVKLTIIYKLVRDNHLPPPQSKGLGRVHVPYLSICPRTLNTSLFVAVPQALRPLCSSPFWNQELLLASNGSEPEKPQALFPEDQTP